MATKTFKGTGAVALTDHKDVKYVGKTKSGVAVTIKLKNAINMGDIDLAFAEKDDTVAAVTFSGCYDNTDAPASSTEEPWEIECADDSVTGAAEILVGCGLFYIGTTCVGLTRGGGSFKTGRSFRNINADGDRGPVKGRVVMDSAEPTLTLNMLQILTNMQAAFPAMTV